MDCLILCGGRATRLGPLAADRPKVLMDVHGRPFLEHLLRFYGPHADRVLLLAGHLADRLAPYASERVEVVVEPAPLDTGGAIVNALGRASPRFLVANGDTLFVGLDLPSFLAAAGDAPATIAVTHGPTLGRGCVEVQGRRVVRFLEKEGPPEGFTYAGLAVFDRRALTQFPRGRLSLERVLLPRLAADGLLHAWPFPGRLYDIGTPEGLGAFRDLRRIGAVFLDRDGTLIEEVDYLASPDEVRLIPGAADAVARLNALGVPVVVVTNQAGVARGYFPESGVAEVHARLDRLLAERSAHVDRYYVCPHHPTEGAAPYRRECDCRKPRPGLLLRAAAELGLDLAASCMVGDKLSDLEAGAAAGCRTVLVRTGYGARHERPAVAGNPRLLAVVDSLPAAVDAWLRAHEPEASATDWEKTLADASGS